ncbi:MAG TPA: hypothetical protein PLU17_05490 [Chitinophagaceae bacterium]|nr:hypothetical protein [Chitinophagaceae bacterium]
MWKLKLIIALLLSSCASNTPIDPIYEDYVLPKEAKFKFGDCFYFKADDSMYASVILSNYSNEEDGIWYEIFYSDYYSTDIPKLSDINDGKVMGRKVKSMIDEEGFKRCLDGELIQDKLFTNNDNFKLIGNIKLKGRIFPGSQGMISSMKELRSSYEKGRKIRVNPPDHYNDLMKKMNNFHPEEYFQMSDFIKQ